jgi:hypothetical protein
MQKRGDPGSNGGALRLTGGAFEGRTEVPVVGYGCRSSQVSLLCGMQRRSGTNHEKGLLQTRTAPLIGLSASTLCQWQTALQERFSFSTILQSDSRYYKDTPAQSTRHAPAPIARQVIRIQTENPFLRVLEGGVPAFTNNFLLDSNFRARQYADCTCRTHRIHIPTVRFGAASWQLLTTSSCVQPINKCPLTNAQHFDSPGGNLYSWRQGFRHILPADFASLAKFDCYRGVQTFTEAAPGEGFGDV